MNEEMASQDLQLHLCDIYSENISFAGDFHQALAYCVH